MIQNILKLFIIVAIVTFIITLFPIAYDFAKTAIEWILSLGKWGIILIISFIFVWVIDFFKL